MGIFAEPLRLSELRGVIEEVCERCYLKGSFDEIIELISHFPNEIKFRKHGDRGVYTRAELMWLMERITKEEQPFFPECLPSVLFTQAARDSLIKLWFIRLSEPTTRIVEFKVVAEEDPLIFFSSEPGEALA